MIEDKNKITDSAIGGVFRRQDLVLEADFSEEMNRLEEMTGRVSSAMPVDKKDTYRGIVAIASYVGVPNT